MSAIVFQRPARALSGKPFSRAGLLVIGLLSLIGAPMALAVGFGEVRVLSALNEPLRADIPLLDSSGLEADQIQVRLADAATLQQMGLEEQSIPDDLEVNLQLAEGDPRVIVRSRGPVTEPYVALVLELRVPEGQLLKEFTLLLDPPRTSSPRIGSSSTAKSSLSPSAAPPADGFYRMGDAPETLWRIASKHRPARGITTQQTMLAILRLNPAAFVDGNINRLKASQTLRLPTEEEATTLSAAEALEAVQAQVAAWNGQPVSAPADSQQPVAKAARAPGAADSVSSSESARADFDSIDAAAPDSSEVTERLTTNDANAAPDSTEGRLNIVADPVLLQADNDRLLAEAEQLRSELAIAREEAATALEARDREIDTLRTQVERLKVAARSTDAQNRSSTPGAPSSLMGSAPLESVIMVLLGMALAGGFFWWRGRYTRLEANSGSASPALQASAMRPAEPSDALENPVAERSIPPPLGVQALTESVPEIAESKPAATAITPTEAAPEPSIDHGRTNVLGAADLRLEADDIDALDPDTLALEMDIPAPNGMTAPGTASEALPALEGAEFDFLDDLDSTATKLDLARAYREMGDSDGAREILKEVMEEGNAEQQQAARELLATL